eukprot:scaffold1667_cov258-Pinguiococcus_pyrenoidosus.AAC.11
MCGLGVIEKLESQCAANFDAYKLCMYNTYTVGHQRFLRRFECATDAPLSLMCRTWRSAGSSSEH